jgi:chondroitin sulfate proteoglycan 4
LHTTEAHRISFNTKPVRIMIKRNHALNVFPLTRKIISSELLLSKCTDADRDIKYFIRNGPTMGKIIMETNEGIWLEVDRFTQKDLNNSRVSYEHNKQFNNLTASDNFIFDIETHFTTSIKNQV